MTATAATTLGRYELLEILGSGGMATVHLGRLATQTGFSRLIAIKQLHAHLARDPQFVAMFLDEARLAARVRHAHVVSTLDVLEEGGAIAIVMEYVDGISLVEVLNTLHERHERMPIPVAAGIVWGVLQGLHAAHEAQSESGELLRVVHRDVSPNNVIVGHDGVARLLDFGVAKAIGRLQSTGDTGRLKGTFAYMSPEQARAKEIDRRSDVYSASVVLWECLTGTHLFSRQDAAATLTEVLYKEIEPPSAVQPEIDPALDTIVMKGLAQNPEGRYATALEMARAMEGSVALATSTEIAAWLDDAMKEAVAARRARIARVEEQQRAEVARDLRAAAVRRASDPPPTLEPPRPDGAKTLVSGDSGPTPVTKWRIAMIAILALSGAFVVSRLSHRPPASAETSAQQATVPTSPPASEVAPPPSASAAAEQVAESTSDASAPSNRAAPHAATRARSLPTAVPAVATVSAAPPAPPPAATSPTESSSAAPAHGRPGVIPDERK
jgi:serine/threonine-protein kinase